MHTLISTSEQHQEQKLADLEARVRKLVKKLERPFDGDLQSALHDMHRKLKADMRTMIQPHMLVQVGEICKVPSTICTGS